MSKYTTLRPLAEWHEDYGAVLWWMLPIVEPPYCGCPLSSDWPGCYTHWTPIIVPGQEIAERTKMTLAHEDHLTEIKRSFFAAVDAKYRAGVKQHGGKLWEKPFLIEKAMEECVDQYVFLFTLKMQRDNPSLLDPSAKDIDE